MAESIIARISSSQSMSNEFQRPDHLDPPASARSPSPPIGATRTLPAPDRGCPAASYGEGLKNINNIEVLPDDADSEHFDGFSEPETTCFSCGQDSIFCKLHRPHGLPLHSIAERRSQSTMCTGTPASVSTDYQSAAGYSNSAPQTLSASSHGLATTHSWPLSTPQHGEDGIGDVVTCTSGARSPLNLGPPAIQNEVDIWTMNRHAFPATRSAPNLSPKKTMSDALREVARLLRGHSPSKISTRSDVSGFSMLPPERVDENGVPHNFTQDYERKHVPEWTLRNNSPALPESPKQAPYDLHVACRMPLVQRKLTVRNRSSQDTLPSSPSSSRIDVTSIGIGPGLMPQPLFSVVNTAAISNTSKERSSANDNIHGCPGYWPPIRRPIPAPSNSPQSESQLHLQDSPISVLLNPESSTTLESLGQEIDNFHCLRLSSRDVAPDYARAPRESESAQTGKMGRVVSKQSSMPPLTTVSRKLTLWPKDDQAGQVSDQTRAQKTRLRSISSMLRVPASHLDGGTSKLPGLTRERICTHARSSNRPSPFSGFRLKPVTPRSWLHYDRTGDCWRCELLEFRDNARQKARSEGYLTRGKLSPKTKRHAHLRRPRSSVSLPAKEWVALPRDSQGHGDLTGDKESLDDAEATLLPVLDISEKTCSHDKAHRCWRCGNRAFGTKLLAWIARRLLCAECDERPRIEHCRHSEDNAVFKRSQDSLNFDHSRAPRLKRVATRSSIN